MAPQPRLSLVVAADLADAIGRGNALPWHLPDDLKRFKQLTLGKPILMGGNTARSIGKVLPGRRNLVLTRALVAPIEGMQVVRSMEEAQAVAGDEELMVIGGGEVYGLALPQATRLYLTRVHARVDGADAYFRWDPAQWQLVARDSHAVDARHALAFDDLDYVRR